MFTLQDYVSTVQAGEILGVSRIQVFHWIKSKTLPGTRFGGKIYMIRRSDVERLKADRERKGKFAR
jgi:excisionase family DNA binding protein